jgi:integrase
VQSPEIENSGTAELLSSAHADTVSTATATIRRKRGKSLSRRIGQAGNVFQHCSPWSQYAPAYGRYWIDVPGNTERKRRTIALGLCPSRSTARRKLREHLEREGINSREYFNANAAPAMKFRTQAEKWIASIATRRRRPVKPATVHGYQHALDKWILPTLGEKLLADVSNGALKELVEKMDAAKLSAKTIVSHALVVKLVMASAVGSDGDQLYPRKWNHDFIGLPIVKKEEQERPTVTENELASALGNAKGRYAVIFALLAGSGLRIGEAQALKTTSVSPDGRILNVRFSIWRGQEQEPKTPAAIRVVDIAEPLARLLSEYVAGKSGYLFATKSGRPLAQRNILRAWHAAIGKKVGLHSLRRFRTETLRRARVPEDLIKLWLGHSKKSVTDFYAGGLQNDTAWRSEWVERAGLRFSCGLQGLQNVVAIDSAKVA